MGERVPQHVQNLVIRDYCSIGKLDYLLHVTEYGSEDCFIILNQLLEELNSIDGIVMYSLFQLPVDKMKRRNIYSRIMKEKKSVHFAVERLSLFDEESIERIENIWDVKNTLGTCLKFIDRNIYGY